MSKDASIYNKVNGTEAFLSGLVEAYTEIILSYALGKISRAGFCISLISDVYAAGENNEITIQQAIKKRINEKCFDTMFDNGDVDEDIIDRSINSLKIVKLSPDINKEIEELIKVGTSNASEMRADIEQYTKSLEWYLGKPMNIYQVCDRNGLFDAYIYIPFGIIIIEYEEFYLMIGIGTDD